MFFSKQHIFLLNEKIEVDWRILKSDYLRSSLAETSTKKSLNSQIYIKILKEDSVFSFLNSYDDQNE